MYLHSIARESSFTLRFISQKDLGYGKGLKHLLPGRTRRLNLLAGTVKCQKHFSLNYKQRAIVSIKYIYFPGY